MASKASIIAAIQAKVGTSYSLYRIGLTHDLAERKAYWRDAKTATAKFWSDWKTDSLSDAQDIERHFINKGMQGGTGGDLSDRQTVHVYVF
jgi:hypothetical protein